MTTASNPPIAGLAARIRSVADLRPLAGQLRQLRSAVVRREAYALPDLIAAAAAKPAAANANTGGGANGHWEIIRLLRRTRLRARRLLKAIIRAMSNEPNPPTFAEIMARALGDHPEPISPTCICHGARPVLCFGPAPAPPATAP